LVREAIKRGVALRDLPVAVMRSFHPAIDETVLDVLDPEVAVERRKGVGATSSGRVREAIAVARKALGPR
jgi:argininosuccinate lyase